MRLEDSLSQAFQHGQVAHIVIDLRRYYCDPEFNLPVERKFFNFPYAKRLVKAVDAYLGAVLGKNGQKDILNLVWLRQARDVSGKAKPPEDTVKEKFSYDAFDRTNLGRTLFHKNIQVVLISGLFKNVCVLETAQKAKGLGYQLIIIDGLSLWSARAHQSLSQTKTQTRAALAKNNIPRLRSRQVLDILATSL